MNYVESSSSGDYGAFRFYAKRFNSQDRMALIEAAPGMIVFVRLQLLSTTGIQPGSSRRGVACIWTSWGLLHEHAFLREGEGRQRGRCEICCSLGWSRKTKSRPFLDGFSNIWRRGRDLNPRTGFKPRYPLSRRAPSANSATSPQNGEVNVCPVPVKEKNCFSPNL